MCIHNFHCKHQQVGRYTEQLRNQTILHYTNLIDGVYCVNESHNKGTQTVVCFTQISDPMKGQH